MDGAVSSAAAASHTHPWDQVTGKPTVFAPAAHRHPWADLDGVPATFAPAAHTHDAGAVTSGVFNAGRLPAASASAQGAMSAAHFNRVQGASSVATPGTLALLDAAGRTQFADPSAAADAATKNYVDGQIGTRAPASHTHPWSQITGAPATFPPSAHTHTLAQITDAPSWLSMSVTTAPTGSTIVSRNSNGDFLVNTPTSGGMPASKSYVDSGLSSKSDATHEHASLVRSTGATFGIYSDDSVRLVDSDGVTRFRIAKSGGNGFLMNTVVDWDSLSGKPSTYSPSGHTHSGDDITSGEIPFARINGTRSVHSNTATNRSVWVTADGRFGQNTSSRRFKARERPWSGAGVLALDPVTYVRRDDDGNEPGPDAPRELGLIAEDVEPHLPEIVQYDPEGRVEALRYDLIPVALIPVVRDLVARVEELEAR